MGGGGAEERREEVQSLPFEGRQIMVMSLPITYYSKGNESLTYLSQNKAH